MQLIQSYVFQVMDNPKWSQPKFKNTDVIGDDYSF